MKGILYGVGVGSGNPGMLTLKAVDCIRSADIICLPQAVKEECRAYRIAEQAVPETGEKRCICCDFRMIRDRAVLERMHQRIYMEIRENLADGRRIAFLTIGDPAVYSTFSYISGKAAAEGFRVEMVNGVASFTAAAAAFGISLCEGDEELHIGTGRDNIDDLLGLPGTKVIMKCGRTLPMIKTALRRMEREKGIRVYAVSDCGLPGEARYYGSDAIPDEGGYMTTIIVKDREPS